MDIYINRRWEQRKRFLRNRLQLLSVSQLKISVNLLSSVTSKSLLKIIFLNTK